MLFSIRRKDGGEDSRQLEFLCRVLFAMRHSVIDLGHVLRAAKDAQDGPLVMDSTGAETQTSRLTTRLTISIIFVSLINLSFGQLC